MKTKRIHNRQWLKPLRRLIKMQLLATIILGMLTVAAWITFFLLVFKHF
ncbi:MAG: hypothetical protein J5651_00345 [Salinivirgaceae bacterium]|nr:hypothetical protein [Salinivirgaceae bacterium]